MRKHGSIMLIVTLFMAIALTLFLPGLCLSGSLEPSDPPGPTMKTLDQIPPTWSQKLQCDTTACPRFQLVLDGTGVLDKETGVVWEQSPNNALTWFVYAGSFCETLNKGGRKGWRLPTLQELASLVDPTQTNPSLPSGHPFSNVNVTGCYWSATASVIDPSGSMLVVSFSEGGVFLADNESSNIHVWCVRGGQVVNPQ